MGGYVPELHQLLCSYNRSAILLDPDSGASGTIRAGFEFDVPVRFDTDRLEISLTSFAAGDIPAIPLVEIRL